MERIVIEGKKPEVLEMPCEVPNGVEFVEGTDPEQYFRRQWLYRE